MSRRYPGVFQREPGGLWYWSWKSKVYTHGKTIQRGRHFTTAAEAWETKQDYIRLRTSRSPSYEKYEKWTVEDLCRWYRTEYDEVHNRRTTVAKTRSMCDLYIIPMLGKIGIYELTHNDTIKFENGLIRYTTESTVYNGVRTIKKILNKAVEAGILDKSPCRLKTPPKPKRGEGYTIEAETLIDLIETVKGEDRSIIATSGIMGRRKSEIEGLQWGDLDFKNGVLHVRRQCIDGEIVPYLKSQKGSKKPLCLPMPEMYVQIMKEWKLEAEPSIWVFPGISDPDKPRSIQSWRNRVWNKRIKPEYGIDPGMRLHDLRHTFATILIANGVDLAMIQDLIGHASIITTKDIYGHLRTEHLRKSVSVFDRKWKEAKKARGG